MNTTSNSNINLNGREITSKPNQVHNTFGDTVWTEQCTYARVIYKLKTNRMMSMRRFTTNKSSFSQSLDRISAEFFEYFWWCGDTYRRHVAFPYSQFNSILPSTCNGYILKYKSLCLLQFNRAARMRINIECEHVPAIIMDLSLSLSLSQ